MSAQDKMQIGEGELLELFRRRRPDPEAFRAGVARRIAERAEEPDEAEERPDLRALALRRAAALVALDPAGGATPLALVKGLSAALLVPFLLVGLHVVSFVGGAAALRRSIERAQPVSGEPRPSTVSARRGSPSLRIGFGLVALLQVLGAVLFLLPGLGGVHWALDLLTLLFVLASAGLVLSVRGLAESGWLTPKQVTRLVTGLLIALFAGVFLWIGPLNVSDADSDLGFGASAAVVLLGTILCPLLARRRSWMHVLGAATWVSGLVLFLNPIGVTFSSPGSLARQLEDLELRVGTLTGWQEAGRTHAALRVTGHAAPALEHLRAPLERALLAGEVPHSTVWGTAEELGWIDETLWRRLAAELIQAHKLEQLLKADGPLHLPVYDEYLFAMLLATRTLSDAERAHLVTRVEASWPAPGTHAPLAAALLCVRVLDRLGASERVEARRADVHALLEAHWVDGSRYAPFQAIGGFTSDAAKFQTSFEEATLDAVELMQRLGVPEGIDLRVVRGYLRSASRAFPLVLEMYPYLHLDTRAGLLLITEGIGLPERSLLARLLGERLLIASLLIVGLCALAVRLTPATAGRGALP